MKKWLFVLFCFFATIGVFANDLESYVKQFEAAGFVNDFGNLIKDDDQEKLEQKIIGINDTTSIQFAVFTTSDLEGHEPKAVAEALGNYWGVGQKDLNNGILILASVRDRAIHISLGDGVDDYIPDKYIKTLIKKVVKPAFQKGQYALGINNAVEKIYMQLRGTDLDKRIAQKKQTTYWIVGVFCSIMMLLILFWFIKKR